MKIFTDLDLTYAKIIFDSPDEGYPLLDKWKAKTKSHPALWHSTSNMLGACFHINMTQLSVDRNINVLDVINFFLFEKLLPHRELWINVEDISTKFIQMCKRPGLAVSISYDKHDPELIQKFEQVILPHSSDLIRVRKLFFENSSNPKLKCLTVQTNPNKRIIDMDAMDAEHRMAERNKNSTVSKPPFCELKGDIEALNRSALTLQTLFRAKRARKQKLILEDRIDLRNQLKEKLEGMLKSLEQLDIHSTASEIKLEYMFTAMDKLKDNELSDRLSPTP